MTTRNDEFRAEVMSLLRTNSAAQVARITGRSRERIRQIIQSEGGYPDYAIENKYIGELHITKAKLLAAGAGQKSDREVAAILGVTHRQVANRRNTLGIPRRGLTKIGCSKCDTNPYARGLCKSCYERSRRRGLIQNYSRSDSSNRVDKRLAKNL